MPRHCTGAQLAGGHRPRERHAGAAIPDQRALAAQVLSRVCALLRDLAQARRISQLDRARDQAIECACAGEDPRPRAEKDGAPDVTRARPSGRALAHKNYALLLEAAAIAPGWRRCAAPIASARKVGET